MRKDFYGDVVKRFCFQDFCFEGVRFESPDGFLRSKKQDFDLIVFHPKKVIFFAEVPDTADMADIVIVLRTALNSLCNKLSVSMHNFVVCGANGDGLFFLNKYNDNVSIFGVSDNDRNLFLERIENELSFGPDVFNSEIMGQMRDLLLLSSGVKDSGSKRIKVAADGTMYVRKHGTWKEASAIHPETLFLLTVFGGMFGMHLFYQRKRAKGILYALTYGLFGFGWFFDSFEILFGFYRDPDGRYVAPLQSKIVGVIMFLIGALIFCLLGMGIMFLPKYCLS